ncbi:MAG: hypothetical protein IKP60_07255 [Treponema sp.]|nr:hypothetical protein [Treponema sp.]
MMINQGFNLGDYQRNQIFAQQTMGQGLTFPQFTPRSARKNMYSVVEVQSDDEIRNFKIESGVVYIFLNENSDRLYIRQINERNELVTYVYKFTQDHEDELVDPVVKLERRLENIEKLLGGITNVHAEDSEKPDGNDCEAEAAGMETSGPGAVRESRGVLQRKK